MPEKTILQKLFLKSGYQVIYYQPPANLFTLLGGVPEVEDVSATTASADFILAFVNNRAEMESALPVLKFRLKPGGLLWLAYHKGTSNLKTDIHRDTIYPYGLSIGLQAVAMVALDNDWATMRFKVIA